MFDLVSSEDFYTMLVQDFDDFMAEQSSSRRALHCAISAYHLHEWVWGDWLKKDPAIRSELGIRDKDQFLKWIDSVCPWFPFVQELCNGAKHFRKTTISNPISVRTFGAGPDGLGPYGVSYLALDLGEESAEPKLLAAVNLLEVVVRFWRDFFRKYLPAVDLPASRYHVD